MKWIKTSDQRPEIGTFCLCVKRIAGVRDFDIARYGDGDDDCWVVLGPVVWDCAFHEVSYYDYWMTLDKIDHEASSD